jgi:hypothetical protein
MPQDIRYDFYEWKNSIPTHLRKLFGYEKKNFMNGEYFFLLYNYRFRVATNEMNAF